MLILFPSPLRYPPAKLGSDFKSPPISSPKFKFKFECCCSDYKDQQLVSQGGFSVLERNTPWERGSVWSTMGLYFFSLHIPLSFGGLSVVAQFLHQPDLDSETKALSLLGIETLELFGAVLLLQYTAKPQQNLVKFLKHNKLSNERNWLLVAVLGFLFLVFLIFLTSFLADGLIGSEVSRNILIRYSEVRASIYLGTFTTTTVVQCFNEAPAKAWSCRDVNNPTLKTILQSSKLSCFACTFTYCIIAPLLEELVYRGFLLTCLTTTMKWQQAVFISSVIFSASHLSDENFLPLFVVGSVLGCSYCWSGNLASSITLHSLYNAFTLLITFLS